MKNQLVLAVIGTALLVGGASFYGGIKYSAGKTSSVLAQGGGFVGRNVDAGGVRGVRGGTRGGGFASGQIIAVDDKSITVELWDGALGQTVGSQGTGSKIIFFSTSTQVMKTTQGSANDLVVGEQVTTAGTANADGSVTAQSIQIRPTPPSFPTGR